MSGKKKKRGIRRKAEKTPGEDITGVEIPCEPTRAAVTTARLGESQALLDNRVGPRTTVRESRAENVL